MFVEIFPRSFRSKKKVPKSKFSKTTLLSPIRAFVYKVNAFHIENDFTIPTNQNHCEISIIAVLASHQLA
jgi:hypothetical protein